jgi:small conductance mechanosensitive channel
LGFTIGFALQDVSANFVAGFLLLIQQPFDIGNFIEVAGYDGKVLAVDLRATELLTSDGRRVMIPNSEVFSNPIINFTRTERRRIALPIGIA